MNPCHHFEEHVIDAANGVAEVDTLKTILEHIETCETCFHTWERLQSITSATSQRNDPGEAFWENYFDNLERRMAQEVGVEGENEAPLGPLFKQPPTLARISIFPRWSLQIAAAVVILFAGIWIGQSYFGTPPVVQLSEALPQTELENQALSYLDRSKTLLLGLANFNPEEDDLADLNMDRRKSIAGGLIQEASVLKSNLSNADQQRLSELISDLEVILLQIANLESEFDIPEIEMVKNGVDRKAIFFKIDVENMLRDSREPEPKKTSTPPQHSAI